MKDGVLTRIGVVMAIFAGIGSLISLAIFPPLAVLILVGALILYGFIVLFSFIWGYIFKDS